MISYLLIINYFSFHYASNHLSLPQSSTLFIPNVPISLSFSDKLPSYEAATSPDPPKYEEVVFEMRTICANEGNTSNEENVADTRNTCNIMVLLTSKIRNNFEAFYRRSLLFLAATGLLILYILYVSKYDYSVKLSFLIYSSIFMFIYYYLVDCCLQFNHLPRRN